MKNKKGTIKLIAEPTWDDIIMEAIDVAIAALEKQIPKEMEPAKRLEADITIGRTIFRKGTSVLHKCPACGEYLPTGPYCRFCGQRLAELEE